MDQDAIDARTILGRSPPGVLDGRLYEVWRFEGGKPENPR
jgi:hypothetical protein